MPEFTNYLFLHKSRIETHQSMDNYYRDKIKEQFIACVNNTMKRVKKSLDSTQGGNHKPFHTAVLIPEAILWSKYERSFSTSFGQSLIEQVSKLVALAHGAEDASLQKRTIVSIPTDVYHAIDSQCQAIKEGKRKGHWETDIQAIEKELRLTVESHAAEIISDLWFKRDGLDHYFSIKTVKPNIDQTLEAKRDLLKIYFSDKKAKVYFGLYYNPWGENRLDYKHNPPMKVFDFYKDEVVLIGKDYWDTIGQPGTYEELIDIAKDAGKETQPIVQSFTKEIERQKLL